MIKEDIKVEVNPCDDKGVEKGELGQDDDDKHQVYATISAEHKAKKRWRLS